MNQVIKDKYFKLSDGEEINVKEIHYFPDGTFRLVVDFHYNAYDFNEVRIEQRSI